MSRVYLVIFLIFLFPKRVSGDVAVSGPILVDTDWKQDAGVCVLESTVTVGASTALTIGEVFYKQVII